MQKQLKNILRNECDPAFAHRARAILNEILRLKPKTVLDAGCGRGFYIHLLSYLGFIKQIHGFDLNASYLAVAKKHCTDRRITLNKASIYSLPYPNDYFDFIIFSEVLEHVKNEKIALKELQRVLKKNGTVLITVPNENFPFLWDPLNWILMKMFNTHVNKDIWWLAGIWADHERLYSEKKLKKTLSRQFDIVYLKKIVHWSWPFSHFLLYGIGKNIVEKFSVNVFNRFEFDKPRTIVTSIASFMSLPSFMNKLIPIKESVNLLAKVRKKKS